MRKPTGISDALDQAEKSYTNKRMKLAEYSINKAAHRSRVLASHVAVYSLFLRK